DLRMRRITRDHVRARRHLELREVERGRDRATHKGESALAGKLRSKPRARLYGEGQMVARPAPECARTVVSRRVDLMHGQRFAIVEIPQFGVGDAMKTGVVVTLKEVMDRGD